MSRTVSTRIPTELHEDLRERCNLVGESINDYVKAAIEFALYGISEFDFGGDKKDETSEKESKPKIFFEEKDKKTPEMIMTSIDGKPVQKNSEGKYVYL